MCLLLSPCSPLLRLQHLEFTCLPYPTISQYFRPTIKYISLRDCRSADTARFLRVLHTLPLLEEIHLIDMFRETIIQSVPGPPSRRAHLPFLRELYMGMNSTVACGRVLDEICIPSSASLTIYSGTYHVSEETDESMAAAISKMAGFGVLDSSSPINTLLVDTMQNDYDISPRVYGLSTTNEDIESITRQAYSTSEGLVFFSYTPHRAHDAAAIIIGLCTQAFHPLTNIRCLVLSNMPDTGDVWYSYPGIPAYWSDALRKLTHLEVLHLENFVLWESSDFPNPNYDFSSVFTDPPFPRLRLLTIEYVWFSEQDNEVKALRTFLKSRKDAGIELPKLVLSHTMNFGQQEVSHTRFYLSPHCILIFVRPSSYTPRDFMPRDFMHYLFLQSSPTAPAFV